MPDHVHLLLGAAAHSPLPRFVQGWKSLCFLAWKAAGGGAGSFWQRGYFEHALRRNEDLRAAANYIWENPVRAGLVADSRCHPLSGSLEWDL
jgi:REP element-mobilizing transposase RayT